MKLKDIKRTGRDPARYVAVLKDEKGASDYEIAINGPQALVEKVFAKCDFETTIAPQLTEQEAQTRAREMWATRRRTHKGSSPAPDLSWLEKRPPRAPTARNSVLVAIRRTRGEGTLWSFWFPGLFVPTGVNLFFALPLICHCWGTLFPLSGDPDLFLHLNGPTTPVVAASINGGTTIDSVSFGPWFCWPWTQSMPFFRVNGFLASATGFWFGGHGVP